MEAGKGNVGILLTPIILSAIVTSIEAGTQNRDVPRILFGTVGWFGALAVVGQLLSWRLAAAIAWVHFIYVFLNKGKPAISWFNELVEGF